MAGVNPGNESAAERGRSCSSLESQLQHAWLQSQLPKVQRRSVSAPLPGVVNRAESSVCGRAGDVQGLEKTYFHKSRADVASEFLKRFSTPQLETISSKTDVPLPLKSRNSVSDGSSECDSGSSTVFTTSSEAVFDALDFESVGTGSVDLAGETEPLVLFLDDILANEDLEDDRSLVQQTSAYHAMEKEIADLLAPDSGPGDVEDVEDRFWTTVKFATATGAESSVDEAIMAKTIADLFSPESAVSDERGLEPGWNEENEFAEFPPSEEVIALKLMERYSSTLSRHISDVSGSDGDVDDYTRWITDSDDIQFDDAWKSYLERSDDQASSTAPVFDFNMLLRRTGGADLSRESAPTGSSTPELLYKCALAVSQGKADSAAEYLSQVQSHSSPYGTPEQRMAHYFMEALVAKMSGTGEELYTVITNNHPSDATILKAYRVYVDNNPYIKLSHFFAVKSALDAFEGAPRVHIIHYGLMYGAEWPSLLHHLSLRPEGPPHIRMTGVDDPYPGFDPLKKINDTGQRIAKLARTWGIPFEFQGLAGKWESFTARDFNLRSDEVLAVKTCSLHLIHDDCVLSGSPRELLLKRIRSLNPKVFVVTAHNAACNAPFFMTRFREAVKSYLALYEGMGLSMASDDPHRVILERDLGREILNIVACEGQARVERPEPYRQWQNRLQRAGFTLRSLNPVVYSKIKAMMATFHKDYGVGKDDGWLLQGIHNQVVMASSVWEPTPIAGFMS